MPAAASTAASTGLCAGAALASLTSLGRRFSTVCRSARISSVFTVSMSPAGSIRAVDVHHVVVVEGAHDLADGVGLADGGQELVPQPLAL